jgi:enterochelin esterase-like enzyme
MNVALTKTTMTAVVFMGFAAAGAAEVAQSRPTTRPTTRPQRQITWVNPKLPAGAGLSHHVLASKALGHDVGYVVWLPSGYEDKADQRYPVIYFLHGAGGNESADSAGFSGYLAEAIKNSVLPPVICVFPNGGMSGYRGEVETMIVKELIPLVDRSYRTIAKPASRAVAGFSMGASGAVRLVTTHPDLFCAAAGWGGGPRSGSNPMSDDVTANAEALKKNGVAIMQIKGDKDRPEGNQEFAKLLDKLGIANEINILKDTDHNLGLYYQRSADQLLKFLAKYIKK